jgi:ATPase subunit of ABC transporter with duplicated ATPase domains
MTAAERRRHDTRSVFLPEFGGGRRCLPYCRPLVGALEVSHLSYRLPGGRTLLDDVSFRVGDGEHVALVGANGVGKTTMIRLVAGEDDPRSGTVSRDGTVAVMHQFVGSIRDERTVHDLLVALSPPPVRRAAELLAAAERALASDPTEANGMRCAAAVSAWGDAGGYAAEVHWDSCTMAALERPLADVAARPVRTLSGGEQKRLSLELLLRSEADVLLLDEPDNYLDVPAKEWLERRLTECRKTILFVSHDRQLLARAAHKVVTLEAKGAWTHGGSFGTWHEAREARLARLDEDHRRWRDERRRLEDHVRELRQRLQTTDKFASRLRATQTKIRRHDAAAPGERPKDERIAIRLGGDRSGKRAVTVEGLGLPGVVRPFDTEVLFGERVGVLGLNGTGKTQFLSLLAGRPVEHSGRWSLGARVVAGHFAQTHDHPGLMGRRVLDVCTGAGLGRGGAMAALRRYGLHDTTDQPFETLSGGQQARLQILMLELAGANLLLLDEPTDNLDVTSAEALEEALATFEGTVLAVTHDRWFMRSFDRVLVFGRDGSVIEALEPVWE